MARIIDGSAATGHEGMSDSSEKASSRCKDRAEEHIKDASFLKKGVLGIVGGGYGTADPNVCLVALHR